MLPENSLEIIPRERISDDFTRLVPIHFARRHLLIGLITDDDAVLDIVTDDQSRRPTVENLALTLGREVRMVLARADVIQRAIDEAYQQQRIDVEDAVANIDVRPDSDIAALLEDGDLLDNDARAPVIKLVNLILLDATKRRASDIHVQPLEDGLVVRLRIDGVLFDYLRPPLTLHAEMVSRIKVMGSMDIAEKRLPQDGRATVHIGERLVDLRIASLPTAHGERVVLRLLDKGARLYDLGELGMPPDVLRAFQEVIQRSHGMILMTGPTGSGKSTTLYAGLQRLNHQELNVVTLEDPIEYHLPGISQSQVSRRKGMTFAAGLRSILRQDPDVIMVGEIRDEETARLAIQSALTGHLVLSTLHTNDAAGAVARLLDLGIEPYLVADSLLAVGAQRLVRRLCPHCRQRTPLLPEDAETLAIDLPADTHVWHGTGCEHCNDTGHHDRRGLFELMVVDDNLRQLIHNRAQATEIRAAAAAAGMCTLRKAGVQQILAGETTVYEVLRVTQRSDEPLAGMDTATMEEHGSIPVSSH